MSGTRKDHTFRNLCVTDTLRVHNLKGKGGVLNIEGAFCSKVRQVYVLPLTSPTLVLPNPQTTYIVGPSSTEESITLPSAENIDSLLLNTCENSVIDLVIVNCSEEDITIEDNINVTSIDPLQLTSLPAGTVGVFVIYEVSEGVYEWFWTSRDVIKEPE